VATIGNYEYNTYKTNYWNNQIAPTYNLRLYPIGTKLKGYLGNFIMLEPSENNPQVSEEIKKASLGLGFWIIIILFYLSLIIMLFSVLIIIAVKQTA